MFSRWYWWNRSPVESKKRRMKKYGSKAYYYVSSQNEGIVTIHMAREKRKHSSPLGPGRKRRWPWRKGERQDTHGTVGIQSKRIPKSNAYRRKRKNTRQLLNEY